MVDPESFKFFGIFQKVYMPHFTMYCIDKMSENSKKSKKTIKGLKSERFLLDVIREHSGLSMYELAKKTKWKMGHLDGTIRRLLNSNEIFIRVIERNGRRANLVYSIDQKPSNRIEIPENILARANPLWSDEAFIYALDSSTIGISGEELPDWKEISCFNTEIPILREDQKISLTIPEKFVSFYHLNERHRTVSINGDNILVTISGDIVETKKYPHS